ncbi:MAG: response regulator [Campylobacterota bacterium]
MDYSFVAKHLKEIGFEMRLLLVEDDPLLQKQLQSFLQRFFKTIDIASDGVEAIMLYQSAPYDLVVTDLAMPVMSGTELAANIRELNPQQRIVVVSGNSESERLLQLINIGIDAFIVKPLKMNEVLMQLEKTCQAVYDQKMLDYFSTMLEESNRELREANLELSCALDEYKRDKRNAAREPRAESAQTFVPPQTCELYNDHAAGRELNESEKVMLYTRNEKMSAEEFHGAYPLELDKTDEELELLEDSFHLLLTNAERNATQETLSSLTDILRDYAREIELIPQFGALSYGIQQLARTFESVDDPGKLPAIMPMLSSLFDNLERWRKEVLHYRRAEDIHYLDNSLISDALSLEGLLSNQHAVSSENDIELF